LKTQPHAVNTCVKRSSQRRLKGREIEKLVSHNEDMIYVKLDRSWSENKFYSRSHLVHLLNLQHAWKKTVQFRSLTSRNSTSLQCKMFDTKESCYRVPQANFSMRFCGATRFIIQNRQVQNSFNWFQPFFAMSLDLNLIQK